MTKHIHDEVIRAWLDGKTVQIHYDNNWHDIPSDIQLPNFHTTTKYRIKPEAKKYRVALMMYGPTLRMAWYHKDAVTECVENDSSFVRWLSDWIDYEACHHSYGV